ncbi:MAG: DEAD/DEAH box helicase family protein, partial [Eubacteriales bacterium]
MELILQQGLEHQQIPVERLAKVFENVGKTNGFFYTNPKINLADSTLKANIKNIQNDVHPELRGSNEIKDILNLDIKMETGTGKTYVYAETIFELHKRYGINKFIIAVPSLPIKAGSASFLGDSYVKRHFRDVCGYNSEIELCVLEAMKKKKGKSFFPSMVRDFVQGSNQLTNKIYVLIVNMQLLSGSTKMLKDEYDYSIEGFYRPFDAIRATKPFVIIDEPHRFDKENKAYNTIVNEIKPQCIIRFGATFSQKLVGAGKNKVWVKDYHNLLYDLNACDAFNQNLIKGVAKEHFEPLSKKEEKVKIVSIESRTSASFKYSSVDVNKSYKLNSGDSLAIISPAFEGLFIDGITNNSVLFSNGQEKVVGNEFDVDIFMESYQDGMLKLAIQRHFETERANFNRTPKIK